MRRSDLGRTARLLSLRPPLAFGGHCFSPTTAGWPTTLTCLSCHVSIPNWAFYEGFWHQFGMAEWCPALFRALPRADE